MQKNMQVHFRSKQNQLVFKGLYNCLKIWNRLTSALSWSSLLMFSWDVVTKTKLVAVQISQMWLRNGLQCGTNELEVNHTASWLHGQSVRENTRSAWTIQWGRVHGYKMDFSPLSANWLERDVVSCHLSSFRYMIKDNSFCRSGFYSFPHYIFCSRKIHLKKKK